MKEVRGKITETETNKIFDLKKLIIDYEKQIYSYLVIKDYHKCEEVLTNFCYDLLTLEDEEQLFIFRVTFISIVTDIIRVQARKEELHPRILSYAYQTISTIEKWENITEYLLFIPWFIERLKTNIIADQVLFEGNIHVEKALQLIHLHLEGDILTVKWLADQLGISTTHLSNLFKLQAGETISKYIVKRKIEEIIFELTHTNESLKTIREKYGFSSHSHFTQHFKRIKGVTPLQYIQDF